MAKGQVGLQVNGKEYAGWKSARVTRGIEAAAGKFELAISERWSGAGDLWPIQVEDECAVTVDGQLLLTGYVDTRAASIGPEEHSLTVSGRDKAGALVDCSAVLTGWELSAVPLLQLANQLGAQFGVAVSMQAGLTLTLPEGKLTVDPGEKAWAALEKACRVAGVLVISDGRGGLVLARAGAGRATTALVQGENVLSASIQEDATERFYRYVVYGQKPGSDDDFGLGAAQVQGEATDDGVRRTERVLLVRPEGAVTTSQAKARAQWEAKVRAARAASVRVVVQGWTQRGGEVWPVNALVRANLPMLGVDGDMLITEATYSLDENGTTTQLSLKRPDAFTPEPVVKKSGERWRELAGGV